VQITNLHQQRDVIETVELGEREMSYLEFAAELETLLQHKVGVVSRHGIK
jgi:hypothetical protein